MALRRDGAWGDALLSMNQQQTPQHDPWSKFDFDVNIPGIVVVVSVVAIWPVINLFGLSVTLGIAATIYFLVGMFLYAVAKALNFRRKGWIKVTLGGSIALAALLDPLVFQLQALRFVVVDWAILAFYVAALALGLWGVLMGWMKVFAVAVAVALLVAPFTPAVSENEKWSVELEVLDETCSPLAQAGAQCTAGAITDVSRAAVEFNALLGLTNDEGKAKFELSGNPLLKGAACYALKASGDSETSYPMESTFVAAPLVSRAQARIQLTRGGKTADEGASCPERN